MKKKIVIIFIVLLLIIGIITGFILIKNKETKEEISNNYQIYFNSDFLVRIDLNETYTECNNEVCSDKIISITSVTGLEEKAQELLNEEFSYDDLTNLLNNLINESTKDITIFTNYDNTYLESIIENNNKNIIITYIKNLNDEEMLEVFNDNIKYYTITFDTDGGSSIDSIVVREGELVSIPDNPTKEGYTFKTWQVDGKTYDFNTPVISNLTIKATWKKNTTTNTNTSTNNSGNTNTNSNNTSTIGNTKINLNDNVVVSIRYVGIICGFGMFPTNLKEVFPNVSVSNYYVRNYCIFPKSDCGDSEISDEDITSNLNNLTFDTTKENNAKKVLESINKNASGIYSYEYKIENHRFYYDLYYLDVLDGSFKTDGMVAASNIKNAFASVYVFPGNCGDPIDESTVLNEELCSKYNLNCDRW